MSKVLSNDGSHTTHSSTKYIRSQSGPQILSMKDQLAEIQHNRSPEMNRTGSDSGYSTLTGGTQRAEQGKREGDDGLR